MENMETTGDHQMPKTEIVVQLKANFAIYSIFVRINQFPTFFRLSFLSWFEMENEFSSVARTQERTHHNPERKRNNKMEKLKRKSN